MEEAYNGDDGPADFFFLRSIERECVSTDPFVMVLSFGGFEAGDRRVC